MDRDLSIRLAAFDYLRSLVDRHGEVLPARLLRAGFHFEGTRIRLKGIQGIFKPKACDFPLSITTAPPSPDHDPIYEDGFAADGTILRYRYRGTDPNHHENVRLRRAMQERRPLIYFHGVVKAEYFATWPVFIVGDDSGRLTFEVAIDDAQFLVTTADVAHDTAEDPRRRYITTTTRQRLHQQAFRTRVLRAYRERCALCRLKHSELLDAAHIVPDADPGGRPVVSNGLALCKLHHAAFDQDVLGIGPDLLVRIRPDVLREEDGPMLRHGLQGFEGQRILIPARETLRPDRDLLEARFARFLDAGAA